MDYVRPWLLLTMIDYDDCVSGSAGFTAWPQKEEKKWGISPSNTVGDKPVPDQAIQCSHSLMQCVSSVLHDRWQ